MKQKKTKRVKCAGCTTMLVVSKWAPKHQLCNKCADGDIPATQVENDGALEKLIKAQNVLGSLDFIITSGGRYYKQYSDGESIIKIEPMFDRGTSMDTTHTLEGVLVTRQEFVSMSPEFINKIPQVAQLDMTTLLRELDISVNQSIGSTHIDTVKCAKCGAKTSDWLQNAMTGEFLCIDKCAPAKRPIKINV